MTDPIGTAQEREAAMTDIADAKATVRFAIFNELVSKAPRGSHPYLEQIADIAAAAVEQPSTAWAFQQVSEASRA